MNSAHGDERNLAHSATGRNVTRNTDSIEIEKLKDEHEKQIQKLTFESCIKALELEKEMSKQDKEQKMKILQLEKDNQSLTHELELVKLKTAHEMEARENEFNLKVKDLEILKDKDITAKENECKTKINEMEKVTLAKIAEMRNQIAARENEFKLKANDLENTNKIKLEQMEREKELAIQALRHEIEILKSNNAKKSQNDFKPENTAGAMKKSEKSIVATKEDKLIWGVNEFFLGKKSVSNLYASYQKWYEAISGLLENKVQVNVNSEGKKLVFIRKEIPATYTGLFLVTKRRYVYYHDDPETLIVNCDNKGELKNAKSFLLHPKQKEMCIENNGNYNEYGGCEQWRHPGVTNNHYFGEKRSIIMFLIFKNE